MKAVHSIDLMCQVLKVSRSGFYEWRSRTGRRPLDHWDLKEAIEFHFKASRRTYGHRRVRQCILDEGKSVSLKLTLRLMKEMALEAEPWKPSPCGALRAAQESKVCAHLLERDFKPMEPNQVWTSDITYIWTRNGWSYLAVVLDLFSRRVVGWSVSEKPDTK